MSRSKCLTETLTGQTTTATSAHLSSVILSLLAAVLPGGAARPLPPARARVQAAARRADGPDPLDHPAAQKGAVLLQGNIPAELAPLCSVGFGVGFAGVVRQSGVVYVGVG